MRYAESGAVAGKVVLLAADAAPGPSGPLSGQGAGQVVYEMRALRLAGTPSHA